MLGVTAKPKVRRSASTHSVPRQVQSCKLSLQSRHRGLLYVAPGTDGSLDLYTEETFSQLADRLAQASPTGQVVRAFNRLLYGRAQAVELDRQGRVRIPADLAQLARLEKEVVLLGVRDHLEVWDAKRWEAYLTAAQPRYDEIAEAALRDPA